MKMHDNGYYTNRHSCFLLQYHMVLVTKYRHPVICGELEKALTQYTQNYFKEQGCVLAAFNTMPDHIHILFDAPPQINLANFVNAFKSASSRKMRSLFQKELAPFYWEPYFWSKSYFIATVSDRSSDAVKKYIAEQKN